MSYPTYYISSSVINVDTETTSKIIMLPPASTLLGGSIYIRDTTGFAFTNAIYVSTQMYDLIDNYASTIRLDTNFQSLRVAPWSTTQYSVLTNYIQGLDPFTYALEGTYTVSNRLDPYNFNSAALSYEGRVMLVTASGGATASSNALYVSSDYGGSFSNEENIDMSNVFFDEKCCMSWDGTIMFVTLGIGLIYRSVNTGVSWNCNATNVAFTGIVCTSRASNVFALSDRAVYSIDRATFSATPIYTDQQANVSQFRSMCIGTVEQNGTEGKYALFVGSSDCKIFVTTNGTDWEERTPPSVQGTLYQLACDGTGFIVYARLTVATQSGLEDSLYKSTDRAATWTQLTALSAYNLVTCDNTGTFVNVTGNMIGMTPTCYFSINGGSNFKELTPSLTASAIAMSGDGNYLVAVQTNSAISVGRARLV